MNQLFRLPMAKNDGWRIAVLLLVEAGFNSTRALEAARLLISQMGSVQVVGVSARRCAAA